MNDRSFRVARALPTLIAIFGLAAGSQLLVTATAGAQPAGTVKARTQGCVQQSGVRVGPDQRYRRVVAE